MGETLIGKLERSGRDVEGDKLGVMVETRLGATVGVWDTGITDDWSEEAALGSSLGRRLDVAPNNRALHKNNKDQMYLNRT